MILALTVGILRKITVSFQSNLLSQQLSSITKNLFGAHNVFKSKIINNCRSSRLVNHYQQLPTICERSKLGQPLTSITK